MYSASQTNLLRYLLFVTSIAQLQSFLLFTLPPLLCAKLMPLTNTVPSSSISLSLHSLN
ncbi:hypothetical protein L211DRAFT_692916 [Terfezia boudieri ATCC MYA-4762]|uniref:Uncharacterized protein n=1 Tax=Terfezia boudieri ATCC MYA-4762 TaxID=1051890 RepID=A0A3N4LZG4_9PEZI|nr:hypothetical protein L211DRAFT_692916 [Terfezia boudieri ATCC MYA-4762]